MGREEGARTEMEGWREDEKEERKEEEKRGGEREGEGGRRGEGAHWLRTYARWSGGRRGLTVCTERGLTVCSEG